MHDPILAEVQQRKYVIEGPTRSKSPEWVGTLLACMGLTGIIVLFGLLGSMFDPLGLHDAPVTRSEAPQGTMVVIVDNWPTTPTPTHTPSPTPSPTHSPVEATRFAQMTATAQPTVDPRWTMPFCGDPTTKIGEACIPYAMVTSTPAPTPTPIPPCTPDMFHNDARKLWPCVKTADMATPSVVHTAPTPTMAPPMSSEHYYMGAQ